jgi:hypothetical protein
MAIPITTRHDELSAVCDLGVALGRGVGALGLVGEGLGAAVGQELGHVLDFLALSDE